MKATTKAAIERFAGPQTWNSDRLVGIEEIAGLLGLSGSRVRQVARSDRSFPGQVAHIAGQRLWYQAGIEAWAALHRAGKAGSDNPFTGETASLLRLAEAESLELHHGCVGVEHLWLAIAHPAAPVPPRQLLASLGADHAEVWAAVTFGIPPGEKVTERTGMNPHVQRVLEAARREAAWAGEISVSATSVLAALFDDFEGVQVRGRSLPGVVCHYLKTRGFDVGLARNRLRAIRADPDAAATFEAHPLPEPPPKPTPKPEWLDLAPNPLGRDPWDRRPWGSVFARTDQGRNYRPEGVQWFFFLDRDGFFVRTIDERPVGYRWWPRDDKRLGGEMEILPMPPPEVVDWPERRYMREE